jgi:murein DD-endopeptidase MepM/ murein hydrolase activator NlpD
LIVKKGKEIEAIEDDKELLKEQIEQMEKEQEERDKKILELIALYSDKELLFGDGLLDWPVPGYGRVSSKFGPRIHPVYGYKSNHTGIDIPAPYGQNIISSAAGRVIFAGWGTAYGNYVLIDHGVDKQGRHIVTQYAHCSSMLVVEGDNVLRGDVIAKIGSTGWSTGNHLHYGVQLGGTWMDPLKKTEK